MLGFTTFPKTRICPTPQPHMDSSALYGAVPNMKSGPLSYGCWSQRRRVCFRHPDKFCPFSLMSRRLYFWGWGLSQRRRSASWEHPDACVTYHVPLRRPQECQHGRQKMPRRYKARTESPCWTLMKKLQQSGFLALAPTPFSWWIRRSGWTVMSESHFSWPERRPNLLIGAS